MALFSFLPVIGDALLVLLGLMRANHVHLSHEDRPTLWLRGILGGTGMICIFYALRGMPLADVSIISQLSAFFVMLFAAIIALRPAVTAAWAFFWAAATVAFFASRNACAVVVSAALMAARSGVLMGTAPCLVRMGTLAFFLMGTSSGLVEISGTEPPLPGLCAGDGFNAPIL